ncbi:MAG: hypothetical protein IKC60_02090, partial [Clostridia bacterium]|nr:hypothetical protein [Clostridia bacterium]
DKMPQKYTMTFIDSTLDISALATTEVAFVTGSQRDIHLGMFFNILEKPLFSPKKSTRIQL